jgi:hypothetical protein
MCGHVGIAGNLEHRDEGTLKRLLVFDYFRGTDSTGFSALRKLGEVFTSKMASHPIDLMDTKSFQTALSAHNSTVFLGHNRAATKGKVNGANAHPYTYDHITGAHNGTLDVSSWKALEKLLGEETDVDSQAIIMAIAKFGIEKVVPLLSGAWALVWFDTELNTVNFLRNKERPFWIGYTSDYKKVIWASEWPMISSATHMAPKHSPYELAEDKNGNTFWATEVDWWYRYDLEEVAKGSKAMPKPRVKKLEGKAPAAVVVYNQGGGLNQQNFPSRNSSLDSGVSTTGTITTPTTSLGNQSNVIDMFATKIRPMGKFLDRKKFEDLAIYGCSWCGSTELEYGDTGVTVIESADAIICNQCTHDPNQNRVYSMSAFHGYVATDT